MPETFPRIGSAAVIIQDGKVLLGKRAKDPGRGQWILPGGKIEPFESIASAVKREMREETGLEVELGEQIGAFELINQPTQHRIIVYTYARPIGGSLHAADDVSELRYFSKDELSVLGITGVVYDVLHEIGWLA